MYQDARSTKHKIEYRECRKEIKALKEIKKKLLAAFYGRMDVLNQRNFKSQRKNYDEF